MLKLLLLLYLAANVRGHGYMSDPPNRSSLFRYKDTDPYIIPYKDEVVPNYNDNQNFCGGFQKQVEADYKCGVCGDYVKDAQPRANEGGGTYGKGIIVRQYMPDSIIQVKIKLTAHHKGHFEFRLCPWDNPFIPVTEDCLNQYVLKNVDQDDTKWILPDAASSGWEYVINLQLPEGVICSQCVLQWKYHTGNSWGCDVDNPSNCCVGCGYQEEFYSCSDVMIGSGPVLPPDQQSTNPPKTTKSTTTTTTKPQATTTTTTTTSKPPQEGNKTTKKTTTTMSPEVGKTTTTKPSQEGDMTTEKTTTPKAPTPPSGNGECMSHQTSNILYFETCTSFYQCSNGIKYVKPCPAGTFFNEEGQLCDYPHNVPECSNQE